MAAQTTYDPARNELATMIPQALRINDSRARFRRVQQVVGVELQFEPRARTDIDFIFAAGIILREAHQHADPPHPLGLLSARG